MSVFVPDSTPTFAPWTSAVSCTSGPQPGVSAFMRWAVEKYGALGGFNLGIFNCRTVRGGATTSKHGEGRAADVGFPINDPDGIRLLAELLEHADELGIEAIIYRRRVYSAKSPKGRPYLGVAPHWDHLHIEFSWKAARNLTYTAIKRILEEKVWVPGERSLSMGDRGNDVHYLQTALGITADGIYGPATKRRVVLFEQRQKKVEPKIVVDGVMGPISWKRLRELEGEKAAA
ncbi:peptidoglycan-binding domain-containing protein [Nocardioides marmoraquaticus]